MNSNIAQSQRRRWRCQHHLWKVNCHLYLCLGKATLRVSASPFNVCSERRRFGYVPVPLPPFSFLLLYCLFTLRVKVRVQRRRWRSQPHLSSVEARDDGFHSKGDAGTASITFEISNYPLLQRRPFCTHLYLVLESSHF